MSNSKHMEDVPERCRAVPAYSSYFDASMQAKFTANEYKQYVLDMRKDHDYIVSLRQEKTLSRAEDKAEAKLETARSLKSLAVDVVTISKATGLSLE